MSENSYSLSELYRGQETFVLDHILFTNSRLFGSGNYCEENGSLEQNEPPSEVLTFTVPESESGTLLKKAERSKWTTALDRTIMYRLNLYVTIWKRKPSQVGENQKSRARYTRVRTKLSIL